MICHDTIWYMAKSSSRWVTFESKWAKLNSVPSFRASWSKRSSEDNPGLKPEQVGDPLSLSWARNIYNIFTSFTVHVYNIYNVYYLVWNGTGTEQLNWLNFWGPCQNKLRKHAGEACARTKKAYQVSHPEKVCAYMTHVATGRTIQSNIVFTPHRKISQGA